MTKRNICLAVHVSLLAWWGRKLGIRRVRDYPGRPCSHPPVMRYTNKYLRSNTFSIAWTLLWLKFTGNFPFLFSKAKQFVVDTGVVVQWALIVDILQIFYIKRSCDVMQVIVSSYWQTSKRANALCITLLLPKSVAKSKENIKPQNELVALVFFRACYDGGVACALTKGYVHTDFAFTLLALLFWNKHI